MPFMHVNQNQLKITFLNCYNLVFFVLEVIKDDLVGILSWLNVRSRRFPKMGSLFILQAC